MSSLYLVGPLPALRDTGNNLRCVTQSQNRFPLPVGKSVLGRNSIRDSFPGNSNKIRIGIDALEEVNPRNVIPVVNVSRGRVGLVAVARIGNYTSRRERTLAFIPGEVVLVFDASSFIVKIYLVFFAPRFLALPYGVSLFSTRCIR